MYVPVLSPTINRPVSLAGFPLARPPELPQRILSTRMRMVNWVFLSGVQQNNCSTPSILLQNRILFLSLFFWREVHTICRFSSLKDITTKIEFANSIEEREWCLDPIRPRTVWCREIPRKSDPKQYAIGVNFVSSNEFSRVPSLVVWLAQEKSTRKWRTLWRQMRLLYQTTESESEGREKVTANRHSTNCNSRNNWSNQQPIRFSDRNGILYTGGLRLKTRERRGLSNSRKTRTHPRPFWHLGNQLEPTSHTRNEDPYAVRIRFDLVHFEEEGPITLQLQRCSSRTI